MKIRLGARGTSSTSRALLSATALMAVVGLVAPTAGAMPANAVPTVATADDGSGSDVQSDVPADGQTVASSNGETQAWSVRPTPSDNDPGRSSFFLDAKPGDSVEDSFRVRNLGEKSLTLDLYAADARNSQTGSLELTKTGETVKDVGAWIELTQTKITVRPLDFVDIPFTLKVPSSAEPGDHTGGIVSSFIAPSIDANGQVVALDRRLASRIALRVDGPLSPSLTVSDFKSSFHGSLNPASRGSTDLSYRITNDGNVRLSASQIAKIKSPLGLITRTAALDNIPELLPGNTMVVQTKVGGVWPTIRSSAVIEIKPIPTRPGDEFPALRSARASASVWAVPWAFLLLVLVAGGGTAASLRLRQQGQARQQQRIDDAVAAARAEDQAGV